MSATQHLPAELQQGLALLQSTLAGEPLANAMGLSVASQEELYSLAYHAFAQARYAEAMKAFAVLMTADHTDRRYFSGYGACLRLQKQPAEALKYYGVASMLDLTDPEPVLRMAECHLAVGDRAEARTALDYGLAQARAHPAHRKFVPRYEAMLSFLAGEGEGPDSVSASEKTTQQGALT